VSVRLHCTEVAQPLSQVHAHSNQTPSFRLRSPPTSCLRPFSYGATLCSQQPRPASRESLLVAGPDFPRHPTRVSIWGPFQFGVCAAWVCVLDFSSSHFPIPPLPLGSYARYDTSDPLHALDHDDISTTSPLRPLSKLLYGIAHAARIALSHGHLITAKIHLNERRVIYHINLEPA
jgi:hypothetical protein